MKAVEFNPSCLREMRPAFALYGRAQTDDAYAQMLKDHGPTFAIEHDGRVIACGGFYPIHETCAEAWTVLDIATSNRMLRVHRLAALAVEECGFARIEAHVSPYSPAALRWIKLLGFELEGYKRRYTPSGADMCLFARVKA